jgi:SEC-C motif.
MVSEELVLRQYQEAKEKFPKLLKPKRVDNGWEIDGLIDVIDDEGSFWDTYQVKIIVPDKFPDQLFELHETGNKIQKGAEWHNNDSCCLSTNAVMFSEMAGNITLLNWLDKFAYPFLANHVFKVKTGHYANEEFDHGNAGIIQGYFKVFRTNNLSLVLEKLNLITGIKSLGRNDPCFCNSGKKYKQCFLKDPKKHSPGIPISILQSDLNQILGHIQKKR